MKRGRQAYPGGYGPRHCRAHRTGLRKYRKHKVRGALGKKATEARQYVSSEDFVWWLGWYSLKWCVLCGPHKAWRAWSYPSDVNLFICWDSEAPGRYSSGHTVSVFPQQLHWGRKVCLEYGLYRAMSFTPRLDRRGRQVEHRCASLLAF